MHLTENDCNGSSTQNTNQAPKQVALYYEAPILTHSPNMTNPLWTKYQSDTDSSHDMVNIQMMDNRCRRWTQSHDISTEGTIIVSARIEYGQQDTLSPSSHPPLLYTVPFHLACDAQTGTFVATVAHKA